MAWISFCSRETIRDSSQTSDIWAQTTLHLYMQKRQDLVANYAHSLHQGGIKLKILLVFDAAAILEI